MAHVTVEDRKQTIADKVAFRLERLVLGGELKPGDRLPPERELAERFSASRNGVREAIRRLETLGLLSTEPQSGTYVRDYLRDASFDLILHVMRRADDLDPALLLDLLEYRMMLMTTAARLAATRDPMACSADLANMAAALSATRDPAEAAELDFRFHDRIVKGAGNVLFRSMQNTSRELHLFYTRRFYSLPGALEATAAQQLAIAKAIGSGDPEASAAAMMTALEYGRRAIERMLG
ncbi:MAG TPA: GntR family transcriptional regulator [Spirochaetales bacterium]|nr:GntR family transcriptional regulator [Spirochaetales bacterium]HPG85612.1 GntR family transcriptional regulator [Spirochaetales bacterium]